MTETKAHRGEVLGVEAIEECTELATDAAIQVQGLAVGNDLNAELFVDGAR